MCANTSSFSFQQLIRIPIDKPWKSFYVPKNQIEPQTSNWAQITTAPGILDLGRTCDGKFHDVAVCLSYHEWLVRHKFQFDLDLVYKRAEPTVREERDYGIQCAKRTAQTRFFKILISGIWSVPGEWFEQYCRRIVPYELEIPLERAILNHRVLTSDLQVRTRLCQWIVINGLSLVKVFPYPIVVKLLGMDQDQILRVFQQDHMDLFQEKPKYQRSTELHCISLYWRLFVSCGGVLDFPNCKFDPRYSSNDNSNIIGYLVGINGSNRFGNFSSQVMITALSKSKVFTQHDISMLEIAALTSKMRTCLRIGYPEEYLDLPAEVLDKSGIGALNAVRTYWSHVYNRQPSLKKSDNNILLVLTWSSTTTSDISLNKWASSDDGMNLYRRLLKDVQESQTAEQLTLTLVASLCLRRLCHDSSDVVGSPRGCFLADFDALLAGKRFSNECTVLAHMVFSLSQALGDDSQDITRQILHTVLDTDAFALERIDDRISVQYWICRTKKTLTHEGAMVSSLYPSEAKGIFGGLFSRLSGNGHNQRRDPA